MKGVLVVGSIGYDTVETETGRRESILGGSAVYFSLAARLFSDVAMVGVVGEDFKKSDLIILQKALIDTTCIETIKD